MNAPDQFYIFLASVCCGAAGGILYDLTEPLRCFFSRPCLRIAAVFAADVLFCISFAALYLAVSTLLGFPDLRVYAFFGCLLGFALYLKTLHKIVAFFGKKLYNELKRLRRGRIQCPEKEAKVSPTKK